MNSSVQYANSRNFQFYCSIHYDRKKKNKFYAMNIEEHRKPAGLAAKLY